MTSFQPLKELLALCYMSDVLYGYLLYGYPCKEYTLYICNFVAYQCDTFTFSLTTTITTKCNEIKTIKAKVDMQIWEEEEEEERYGVA